MMGGEIKVAGPLEYVYTLHHVIDPRILSRFNTLMNNPPKKFTKEPHVRHQGTKELARRQRQREREQKKSIVRNCFNCEHFSHDDSGDDWGSNRFPVCALTYMIEEPDNTEKKGFPFAEKQPCHLPGFWQYVELDKELSALFDECMKTKEDICRVHKRFQEKYFRS